MTTAVIEKWKQDKSPSTNANYLTALRSLKTFTENQEIDLNRFNEALVKAEQYVGGLVGYTQYYGYPVVLNSSNKGNIHATSGYVAGLVGYSLAGTRIKNSYNAGNIFGGASGGLGGYVAGDLMDDDNGYFVISATNVGTDVFGSRFRTADEFYAGYYYEDNTIICFIPENTMDGVEEAISTFGLPLANGDNCY